MFRRKFIRLGSALLMILALTLPVSVEASELTPFVDSGSSGVLSAQGGDVSPSVHLQTDRSDSLLSWTSIVGALTTQVVVDRTMISLNTFVQRALNGTAMITTTASAASTSSIDSREIATPTTSTGINASLLIIAIFAAMSVMLVTKALTVLAVVRGYAASLLASWTGSVYTSPAPTQLASSQTVAGFTVRNALGLSASVVDRTQRTRAV